MEKLKEVTELDKILFNYEDLIKRNNLTIKRSKEKIKDVRFNNSENDEVLKRIKKLEDLIINCKNLNVKIIKESIEVLKDILKLKKEKGE